MNKNVGFRFGILDVIIVLIVVLAAFVGTKVLSGEEKVDTVREEIKFTVEVKNAEYNLVDIIKVGDNIYNNKNDLLYGTVSKVDITLAMDITEDKEQGIYSTDSYDNQYNIYIEISAFADSVTERDINLAETKLKIGKMIGISSDKYTTSGYIIGLERIGVER